MSEPHPLDPLTEAEVHTVRKILDDAGKVHADTRFAVVRRQEPDRSATPPTAISAHGSPERLVFVVLLDVATGATHEAVVSTSRQTLVSHARIPTDRAPYGQAPILYEEYEKVEEILRADPGWCAALARRGVTDLDGVFVAPLSAGHPGTPVEAGRRLLRALAFLRADEYDNPWAHPVDGLVGYVDMIECVVVELVDHATFPIPTESGAFDAATVGPARSTLRAIEITQPDGPSFTVTGHRVAWQNWTFRVSFDAREGLVLHTLSVHDGDRHRPVLHRASIAEMLVPYGDPSPTRRWLTYFDVGEFNLGHHVSSLTLGCDCLGEIHYFDAVLADDHCEPRRVPNAICMHEEDVGVLWKHADLDTGTNDVRRSRRLVVSSFVTIGNYDYGYFWYLYLDGTIEMEVKLTGVLFTAATPDGANRYGTEIAPGLTAPYHQHLFCARLDMTVDGANNSVQEVDVVPIPIGEDNPYGNAFTTRTTTLRTERDGGRDEAAAASRTWRIVNPSMANRLGRPVAYTLVPRANPTLLADPQAPLTARAGCFTRHLWVTRYSPRERYPAGDYPNQHTGGAGLPTWIQADRSVTDDAVVVWHTFGATHVPRPEDWPVMPLTTAGFVLRPDGFFDRNPALDLPAAPAHSRAMPDRGLVADTDTSAPHRRTI